MKPSNCLFLSYKFLSSLELGSVVFVYFEFVYYSLYRFFSAYFNYIYNYELL